MGAAVLRSLAPAPVEDDDADLAEATALLDELKRETAATLEPSLTAIHRGLWNMLRGARAALRADNPDRARQLATSCRDLLSHFLRTLGPDEQVSPWLAADPKRARSRDLIDNGKPTRQARYLYICRAITVEPFTDFVLADARRLGPLFKILNEGTHAIESHFTDQQLEMVVFALESFLLQLLTVYKTH